MLRMANEHAAEQSHGQQSIEAGRPVFLRGTCKGEEWDLREFERSDLHILRRQSDERTLRSVCAAPVQRCAPQLWNRSEFRCVVQKRGIRARIELQTQRLR